MIQYTINFFSNNQFFTGDAPVAEKFFPKIIHQLPQWSVPQQAVLFSTPVVLIRIVLIRLKRNETLITFSINAFSKLPFLFC